MTEGCVKEGVSGKMDEALDTLRSEINLTEELVRGLEDKVACLLNPPASDAECRKEEISNEVPLLSNIIERAKGLTRINSEFRKILDRIEL